MRGMKEALAAGVAGATLLVGCTAQAPVEIPDVNLCVGNETNATPTYLGDANYSPYRDPNVLQEYQLAHAKPGQSYGIGTLVCNYSVQNGGFASGSKKELVLTKQAMDIAQKLHQEGK